jgi:hypothetical protein
VVGACECHNEFGFHKKRGMSLLAENWLVSSARIAPWTYGGVTRDSKLSRVLSRVSSDNV